MTPHRNRPLALGLAAALLGAGSLHAQETAAAEILGRWEGTSICIKADWNAACNDETIVYQFEPSPEHAGQMSLHAFKVISGTPEPMYDLEFGFDSAARAWAGDFDNSRVSIRWSYQVHGDNLTGKVVDRRTGRIGRNVTASRSPAPGH